MNIFNFWLTVILLITFSIGVLLLLTEKLTPATFVSYLAIVAFVFLTLFFRDKVSSLKLAGNELQLIQEATSDIRDYLLDIYKVQLMAIAGNRPLSINTGSSKADNVDTILEIHCKLQKYKLLEGIEEELKKAAAQVVHDQTRLLSAYSQVKVSYTDLDSLPDQIEKAENEKSFETASKLLNIPIKTLPSLYKETLEYLNAVVVILASVSAQSEANQ